MFKKRLLRASKLIALGMALAMAVIVPGAQASHWGLSGGVVTHDPTIIGESGSTWWSASTGQGIGMKYSATMDGLGQMDFPSLHSHYHGGDSMRRE